MYNNLLYVKVKYATVKNMSEISANGFFCVFFFGDFVSDIL